MAENKQKLPLKVALKDAEKYKETVEVDFVEGGKTYTVTIYPFFDPIRINNVIKTLRKDFVDIKENGELEIPDELFPYFLLYHTLIEFSDFPVSKSKSIEKRVSYFKELIKTKYFKDCTDMFIQEEFNKVWDRVLEIYETNERIHRMAEKAKEEIENLDLKNPEIKEIINNKNKRIPEA